MLLQGLTAVVTGCNRGIGKAILTAMASEGASVFAIVRKEDPSFTEHCASLAEAHGVEIPIVYADFEQEDEVKAAAKQILQSKKGVDILVNNIGVAQPPRMLAMTNMETIRNVFQVNLFSGILFTQLITKAMMRRKRGSVIFLSSSAAFAGGANIEYSASKAAVIGAVKRLALELGQFGVRVNAVAPGLTDTDMGNMTPQEDMQVAVSRNVMKRLGKPEEVADAVVFLASELSRFITGQVLRVDGGLL